MSDSSSIEQRKKQKRKAAQERKKIERSIQKEKNAEEIYSDGSYHTVPTTSINEMEMETDNFESELCWCINQLELGIKNKKPSKDQAEKALKLLKILRSEKSSKVKKRQIMCTTFGDYRKKMASEAKRDSSKIEPKMIAAGPEKTKDSLFLKQKAEKVEMPLKAEEDNVKDWHFQTSKNDFQFSFPKPS